MTKDRGLFRGGFILKHFLLLALLFRLSVAAAGNTEPLDRAYGTLVNPDSDMKVMGGALDDLPARSNVHLILQRQSPVKSQQHRGTCSIFSSTSLLETLASLAGKASPYIDLSEEWLQFLTTLRNSEEGSSSPQNFALLRRYGQPLETEMPYDGRDWESGSVPLAEKRCGHLKEKADRQACLVSHRDRRLMKMSDADLLNPLAAFYDPDFVSARRSALANRDLFFVNDADGGNGIVRKVSDIHRLLAKGIPLALDLNFFNGAWNYPGSAKSGIYRSEQLWLQGVVTHPERGSIDLVESPKEGDGHSVVVVGYDDEREVEYWMSMTDGTRKKFKRKGVYYFKNSWGASNWGKEFTIDGHAYPGYGMILQVHAHSHGQFYHLNLGH